MHWQIRPLGPWLGAVTTDRKSSGVFRATWDETLILLGDEVEALGGDGTVLVQVDVKDMDLRLDGMLKARARVGEFPGVIVSFSSRHGPLRYATDAYEQRWGGALPGWQANVRAIALSLASLRAVDRYGVTKRGEQYTGWSALPAARPGSSVLFDGRESAETWMRKCAAESRIGRVDDIGWGGLYRLLAKEMHPDKTGGDTELWDRLDAAAKVLGVREKKGG